MGLLNRYYEEMWNTWNFDLVSELLTDDFRFRGPFGVEVVGPEAFNQRLHANGAVRVSGFPQSDRTQPRNSRESCCARAESCRLPIPTNENPVIIRPRRTRYQA